MADNEELHPVVQLLLKRMESHPEEFSNNKGYARWHYAVDMVQSYGSTQEKAALRSAMRTARLEAAHVWALDELCNGDERRKEAERQEEEMRKQQQSLYTQQLAQRQLTQGQLAQAMSLQKYAQLGSAAHGAALQNTSLGAAIPIANGGTGAATNTTANQIKLGNETLDESMLTKIKKSLGI
jgi:hypothetical protein